MCVFNVCSTLRVYGLVEASPNYICSWEFGICVLNVYNTLRVYEVDWGGWVGLCECAPIAHTMLDTFNVVFLLYPTHSNTYAFTDSYHLSVPLTVVGPMMAQEGQTYAFIRYL